MNDILEGDCRFGAASSHSRRLCPAGLLCRAINPSARVHRPVSMHKYVPGRREFLRGAVAAALPLSLYGCGARDPASQPSLVVGGLPVTCNLTLPVACVGKQT